MGGTLAARGQVDMAEVEKHTTNDDAWLVLFGEAIDVTKFIPVHPGGTGMIEAYLGKDATEDWQKIHRPEHLDKHWKHLTKMGRIKKNGLGPWGGGLVGWIVDRLKAPPSLYDDQAQRVAAAQGEEEPAADGGDAEEEVERVRWTAEHEGELPPGGVFDVKELSRWDGLQLPMCIGICGNVMDVSSSDNFVPNFGYGKLWAGKDTTWAMATVSLKAEDANKFDFKLDELSEDHFNALSGWYKHFTTKYRRVGTLKEWKDLEVDWSSVEKLATELPASSMSLPEQ